MPKTKRPTPKQKLAFKIMNEKLETNTPFSVKEVMIESGFSVATAVNPEANLLSKKGWHELLNAIDDKVILGKFYEILGSDDKRASLQAGVELLKLKDRYPANKMKISQLEEEANQFI